MALTYCSHTDCVHLDCARHQHSVNKDSIISIADLNDGLCYSSMFRMPNTSEMPEKGRREKLLRAICVGTQKTNYKCDDVCKAMCGSNGTCAYCSIIADAVEEVV